MLWDDIVVSTFAKYVSATVLRAGAAAELASILKADTRGPRFSSAQRLSR